MENVSWGNLFPGDRPSRESSEKCCAAPNTSNTPRKFEYRPNKKKIGLGVYLCIAAAQRARFATRIRQLAFRWATSAMRASVSSRTEVTSSTAHCGRAPRLRRASSFVCARITAQRDAHRDATGATPIRLCTRRPPWTQQRPHATA